MPQFPHISVQGRPPGLSSSAQRWFASVGLVAAVGIAYFLAARLSLFLLTQPDGVAVFWPAAGVSSGLLIALGRNARWPVALGVIAATIAANLTSDRTVWGSVVFALCNVGEALFTAWLIENFIGHDFSLRRLRHVIWLLLAAIAATAASGIGGALGYRLLHSPDVDFLVSWQHWFFSDGIGIISVAPLVIGMAQLTREPPERREFIEGIAALISVAAAITIIIFMLPAAWRNQVVPVELLFPLLIWLAARCRPAFTAAAVFVVSITIVSAAIFKLGYFAAVGPSTEVHILGTQAVILGTAIFGYVLAALFAERREHDAGIAESENRLRAIVNTVVDGIITIDDRGIVETLNPAAARTFGYGPDEVIGRNIKMLMPEPHQCEHDHYIANYLRTGQAKVIGLGRELVGRRKDGSLFPMELAVDEMDVGGKRMFTGVIRDITQRKLAEENQGLLVSELDHRVKNILAQVAVVAESTSQGSRSIDEFLRSLKARIHSMATAHILLSKSGWQSVGLDALVRNQLAPYATGTNLTIGGANIPLAAPEIQAIARVLHELATNAAKYGALSIPDGRVSIRWECKPNGHATNLTIVWREFGGPPVPPTTPSSYGTNLIRNLIPHELGGAVDFAMATEGVTCRIEIPVKQA